MFERFTKQARQAVHSALGESHRAGAPRIGCEHLLIGLAHGRPGPAGDALAEVGLDVARLRALLPGGSAVPLDADSLALLGIDLDQVRRVAESAFGPGALDQPSGRRGAGGSRARMGADGKKALELALRVAQQRRDNELTCGHLLVGIIDQGDNRALRMLAAAQVDAAALRADVLRRMTGEAQAA
jgi:ATP-dependent Clp protease ATP-binding subunit ClpA